MYSWSLSQNKPEEVLTVIIVLKEPLTILVSIDGFDLARDLSILENLTSMWESDAHKQYSLQSACKKKPARFDGALTACRITSLLLIILYQGLYEQDTDKC